jgi:Ca2+/Na+ antiporter
MEKSLIETWIEFRYITLIWYGLYVSLVIALWIILGFYEVFGIVGSILILLLLIAVPIFVRLRYRKKKEINEKLEIQKIEDNIFQKQLKKK